MAGSNKQSTSNTKVSTSTATVGDGGNTGFSKLPRPGLGKNRSTTLAVILALVILAIGWLILSMHIGQKVYAQAAGHKAYKQDVQTLIGKHKDISDSQAAKVLADKYLAEALGKEQGVTVTDNDMITEYGSSIKDQKTNNKYAYQNKLNQLYFTKLSSHNQGVYKGTLLVTNFSRHVAYQSALLAEDQQANPDIGNPVAIAKDKKYAQELITRLYDQIMAGKISFDQAITIERNDPVVGTKAYSTLLHSSAFDTSLIPNALLDTASIRKQVSQIKPHQTTKPFVVRVSNSATDSSTAESYFLVVRMDSTSGGGVSQDFGQYLAQAKQRLGYKIYV